MDQINISEDIQKDEWEKFLHNLSSPPFLQSWNMAELHHSIGEETFSIAIRKDGQLIGVALTVLVRARRGHYLWLPYGPVFTQQGWKHLGELTTYLKQKGKQLGVDFIRSSPFLLNSPENNTLYTQLGWKPAPIHMLAEHIWWLDISQEEDELMRGMRKTMRNLIRRAGRDGVTIEQATTDEAASAFINIHQETVQRHGFTPYTNDYFRAQVAAFRDDDQVSVFIAKYEGKPIAAAIMMFYGDMASYHHGASLSEYFKIPASYLLQWEAIKEAKKRGCERYNFWGIVPEDKQLSPILKRKHPWIGLSKFKTGFGGTQFDILHGHDYPLSSKYYFTKFVETVRRIKRGH